MRNASPENFSGYCGLFRPEEAAKRLHDYLYKGGFLMVDDFHGADDWEHFMAGMV
jgi:hypothetical protein